jgi:putative flippase GtrA
MIQALLADPWPFVRRLALYGAAGVINTIVGFGVIAALDFGLGVDPHIANALGYCAGVVCAFLLNRYMVFGSQEKVSRTGPRFLIAVGLAFALNQLVLTGALALFRSLPYGGVAAQLVAMVSYTIANFLLCQLWVFRPSAPPADRTR